MWSNLPALARSPRAVCPGSYLLGGELHSLLRQPVLSQPHSEKEFPDVQTKLPVSQIVPIAFCSFWSLGTTEKWLIQPILQLL